MEPDSTTPTRDDRLDDVILAYLKAIEAGETPDRRQILVRHPDMADDLIRFFANKDQLNPFNSTLLPPIPPEPSSETELRSFGDYEVYGKIDGGGMGDVYKARQISLKRFVALKIILPKRAASAVDVQRFIQEAEDVAKLDHPHIVPIYEVNSHDGKPYFSMKLMEGGSLKNRIGDYRLPLVDRKTGKDEQGTAWSSAQIRKRQREIAGLMATIARAVHHAHQRGILHRDLKPGNVLLDAEGKPHVTDFGLAKRIGGGGGATLPESIVRTFRTGDQNDNGAASQPNPEAAQVTVSYTAPEVATLSLGGNAGLTASGAVAGTPPYMAPEQAAASKVLTTSVDVYGLGAILYELVTGRPPFRAETPLKTLIAIIETQPVPPGTANSSINADLEAICLKCLQKDAQQRFGGSAEALAHELDSFIRGEPIPSRPVNWVQRRWRWSQRNPYLASAGSLAAIALVSVAVVSTLFARHYSRAADDLNVEHNKTLKALDDANSQLAENYLEQGLAYLERRGPEGMFPIVRALEVAPDNNSNLQRTIRSVLAGWGRAIQHPFELDSEKRVHSHQDRIVAVAFSPDGKLALTGSWDKTARLWDVATGKVLGPPLEHQDAVVAVAFSPDGKTVLTGSDDNTARLWEVATGKALGPPLKHLGRVTAVAFSPDGKTVLTASWDKTAQVWDVATGKAVGQRMEHHAAVVAVAYSPDGKTVLTGSHDYYARLYEVATGKEICPPMEHESWVVAVAFSPDGLTVLTGSRDKTARLWDVATGNALCLPLQHQDNVEAVAFSPDGKMVLTGSQDKSARLWDAVTGKALGPPMGHQDRVYAVAFSPDGKTALTASHDGTARFWKVPLPLDGDVQRIKLWVQCLTGEELDEHGVIRRINGETLEERRLRLHKLGGPYDP
jgi:WD40 repeat protein